MSRWVFLDTEVYRLVAYVEPHNSASRALLRNCGFTEEGLLRSYRLHPVAQAKLIEDVSHVGLGNVPGDNEFRGDFGVLLNLEPEKRQTAHSEKTWRERHFDPLGSSSVTGFHPLMPALRSVIAPSAPSETKNALKCVDVSSPNEEVVGVEAHSLGDSGFSSRMIRSIK